MKMATQQVGIPHRYDDGWLVPSAAGDQVYEVEQHVWGWTCTCPDAFFRRRRGRLCKHAAAVVSMLLDDEEVTMGD